MNVIPIKVKNIWKNAEKWLIIIFLATFTLNIRKVFLTPYSYLNGQFNEYMTPSFSWADLLILLIIIVYAIKTNTGQLLKQLSFTAILDNVIRRTSSVIRGITLVSRETLFLALLVFWIGLSVTWSQYKPMAIYRFAIFVEILLFALLALKSLRGQKWMTLSISTLIFSGLFQSIIGIAQFIHNKSLGIRWLGESFLGPNVDGVAKIMIAGEKHVRAYGTLPHPNILAAYLLIPIFILLTILINGAHYERHLSNKVSRVTFDFMLPKWLSLILLIIITTGFCLTFSRSAFLSLSIGIIIYLLRQKHFLNRINYRALIFFLPIILITFYLVHSLNIVSIFSKQSLSERNIFQNVARETISSNPIAGLGIGQFVYHEYINNPSLAGWQFQPVHNTYLLIVSEIGIIGLIIFLAWILSVIEQGRIRSLNISGNLTSPVFCCIMISFLIILIFDHYFWDIKVASIIFTIPIIFPNLNKKIS